MFTCMTMFDCSAMDAVFCLKYDVDASVVDAKVVVVGEVVDIVNEAEASSPS